ncbi:G-protein coupled receptor 151 [Alosa pseudoharengus]|uniref:G-protein coupled receptor 151 n=1 Tax=Alosa pseudoharengus TaxID=34774 RepID=UPI003F8CB480
MDTAPVTNGSVRNSSVDQRAFLEPDAPLPLEPAELRVLIPVILGVLCVLGLAGNVTAMGVLISNARKAKLSLINALLLNLLLADGLVLAFVVPSKAAVLSRVGWPLGWFVCKTGDWFVQTCLAAKSVTLAVMSGACHRYVSNPSRVVSVRPARLALLLSLLWVLSGSLALPAGLYAALVDREGAARACVRRVPVRARHLMWAYTRVYPLLAYCCPLAVAMTLFCHAYCQSRRRGSKSHSNLRAQVRSRKLTLTLLGLALAMATLWLPHWLWWAWPHGGRGLWLAAELLPLASSLVDPALVLALSDEFRQGYQSLWRRLTLRQAPPPAKPKPSPHTPTAPTSPRPRPETSLPPAELHTLTDTHTDTLTQPGESPADVVLPDVEQFWHERENTSHTDDNDPIPWEHPQPVN